MSRLFIFNFNRSRRNPYHFLIWILVGLSPLLVLFAVFELALLKAGEAIPISCIADNIGERDESFRFMRRYFDQGLYRFKYCILKEGDPKLIAAGTSRVMQFRSEMFGEYSDEFLNIGGSIQHLRDLHAFAEGADEYPGVQTIILGVEPWWFNRTWRIQAEGGKHFITEKERDDALDWNAHAALFQKFCWMLLGLRGESRAEAMNILSVLDSRESHSFGFFALQHVGAGFRRDGSYDYGLSCSMENKNTYYDREDWPLLDRIDARSGGFEGGGIDREALALFRSSLHLFRERNLDVVCFLPPFSDEVNNALLSSDAHRDWWMDYRELVPLVIEEFGYACIDATSTTALDLTDLSMYDGMHALETFHVRLLERMGEVVTDSPMIREAKRVAPLLYSHADANFWFVPYDAVD